MNDLLENLAVQAGVLPFVIALLIALPLARTRYLAAATGSGLVPLLALTVASFKCIQHPFLKKDRCGEDATGVFKRSEFGMKTFVGPVSDDVRLTINVEAYKDRPLEERT